MRTSAICSKDVLMQLKGAMLNLGQLRVSSLGGHPSNEGMSSISNPSMCQSIREQKRKPPRCPEMIITGKAGIGKEQKVPFLSTLELRPVKTHQKA